MVLVPYPTANAQWTPIESGKARWWQCTPLGERAKKVERPGKRWMVVGQRLFCCPYFAGTDVAFQIWASNLIDATTQVGHRQAYAHGALAASLLIVLEQHGLT